MVKHAKVKLIPPSLICLAHILVVCPISKDFVFYMVTFGMSTLFCFQRLESLFVILLVLETKFVRIILELLIVFVQMVSVVKIIAQVYWTTGLPLWFSSLLSKF